MADPKAKKLISLFQKMMGSRSNWDSHWEEVTRYILPAKNYVFEKQSGTITKGEERHNRIYDHTAEHSNELLASALHSLLTNPTQQFFELTTGDPKLDNISRVKRYLQNLVGLVHETLNNSNFQSEIHETYLDLGAIGTNVLRMDEDPEDLIRFFSKPIFSHWIWENHKGVVASVAEKVKMPVRDAFAKYGMEAFKGEAKNMAKDLEKEITILHITMEREFAEQRALDNLGNPYVSYHIFEERKMVVQEKGHPEFPFAVPRWFKISGEIYGRSPGMKALPEVRYLNQVKKTTIRAAQKAVDPPLAVVDDSVLGRINLRPGGLTSIRNHGREARPIEPIISGARPDIGQNVMAESREEIGRAFFIDQLQIRQADRMTATEINVRDDDRIRLLGPLIGRLNRELLAPIITRIIGILKRRGRLPENMPAELQEADLRVFFKSQIAKAQRLIEAENHQRWLASVAPIAEQDPTAIQILDTQKFVRRMGDFYGIDMDVLKDEKRVQQEQQQAQEQAQEQQQVENVTQLSEAAKNSSQALNPLRRGS